MTDRWDRVFRWVWRIDALLLFLFGLVAVPLAAILATSILADLLWPKPRDQEVSQVAGTTLDPADLRLEAFRAVTGTPFLHAALVSPSAYMGSGFKGGGAQTRNLLFFDLDSKKSHWLLANNERVIRSFSFFKNPPDPPFSYDDGSGVRRKRDQVALSLLLELEPAKDGNASRSLAIASADGRDLTVIVPSIGGLLGTHQAGANSAVVFYVSDGTARVLDLDPTTRQVRSDSVLEAQ